MNANLYGNSTFLDFSFLSEISVWVFRFYTEFIYFLYLSKGDVFFYFLFERPEESAPMC